MREVINNNTYSVHLFFGRSAPDLIARLIVLAAHANPISNPFVIQYVTGTSDELTVILTL